MKKIGTILFYILLVSIIPVFTGFFLYEEVNNSNDIPIFEEEQDFKQYIEYKDSITIKTRNLLINKKFDELTSLLKQLDDKYKKDVSQEKLLLTTYYALVVEDESYEKFYNSWIESKPKSYIPYLVRGIYYYQMGWKKRGHTWISETSDNQIEQMYDYFKKSVKDLNKSKSINKTPMILPLTLMGISMTTGDDDRLENIYNDALLIHANSFSLMSFYLGSLTPRWGGSYEAMTKYLESEKLDISINPKLKILYGHIDSEKAKTAVISKAYNQAHDLYIRSLKLSGENHNGLFSLGKNYIRRDMYEEGISEINRAIELYSENADYYYWRATGYIDLKEYEKAKENILYAIALKPYEESYQRKKIYLSKKINRRAFELRKEFETEKSLEMYHMALELNKDNDNIYYGIAQAYIQKHNLQLALSNIQIAIEIAPNNISHYLLIDYILAKDKDWNQIIGYWNRFIESNPSDGRAYVERGGAYYHMGDMKKAVENAKISAELGNLEGKEAYEKFKDMVN